MIVVDVCVCTHRRTSLHDTLVSLAKQVLRGARMRIIVADNDDHAERRREIELLGANLQLDVCYIHAPAHNISVARNACLNAASSAWVAFIDDDELAAPNWMQELLNCRAGRDVVFGIAVATYSPDTPRWIKQGDFHSARLTTRDPDWQGYTGNVLIKRSFLESTKLRFEESLGETGGEDTLFFYEAMRAGARFGYAPAAVVTEPTYPPKTSLRWLLRRRFRAGQTHELILRREGKSLTGAFRAIGKCGWATCAAALSISRPSKAAGHLLRSALHAGVVAGAFGATTYREFNQDMMRRAQPSVNRMQ